MVFPHSFHLRIAIVCLFFAGAIRLGAQTGTSAPVLAQPPAEKGLFDTDEPLHLTLNGPIRSLLKNRLGSPQKYACLLSQAKADSSQPAIPVEVSTRGHFRRQKGVCTYPPLLIRFPKEGPHLSSVFREQKKLKLVMPCDGDAYIVREWLAYKLYNLITPLSFRARLVQVTLAEDGGKKQEAPFYGILLEEEKQMAKRNGMISINRKIKPKQTQTDAFLTMAVFEYLIGNTDWSVQYQQNIKLLIADSTTTAPVAVAYDFDHSGIVSAPYAQPAEELQMRSVRERRYRGYCVSDMKLFEPVIAHYNRLKNDIYSLYTGCPLLNPKYLKSTLQYLDAFYETINNPKDWQKEFAYPCDPSGTGNIVIKGLKQD